MIVSLGSGHVSGEHPKHICVHDEIIKDFQLHSIDLEQNEFKGKRRLQANTTKNIRIKIDYTGSDTFIAQNTGLTSLYLMSKRILTNVKKYFETFVQVTSPETMSIPQRTCTLGITTNAFTDEAIDLYILIKAENNSTASYFAAASSCALDGSNGRPIAGVYFLNFASMKGSKMYEYFYFTTYTHEFMHILFFSQSLLPEYRNASNGYLKYNPTGNQSLTVNSKLIPHITFPNLVEMAKKYYKCDTIVGIPMEDGGGQGTAGSHWEKLYMNEDIMNPTIENPAKISPFTIELMRSTGWYTIIGEPSSPYDWGKDSGCVFNTTTCPSSREYCPAGASTSKNLCSPDHTAKATCSDLTDYFGPCLVKRKMEVSCLLDLPEDINMGAEEIYGIHSRCISWEKKDDPNTASGECHAVRCVNGEIHLKLKGGVTRVCRYPNEKIQFSGQWQINCPDPGSLCSSFSERCPMDCYGKNGYCLKGGKCFCFEGYTGEDCGTCSDCSKPTDPFILSSNLNGGFVEVDAFNVNSSEAYVHLKRLLTIIIAVLSLI